MSPVLRVIFETSPGTKVQAVLKLYDRRFGADLRRASMYSKHYPHSPDAEAKFESFVRAGKADAHLAHLRREMRKAVLWPSAADSWDDTPDGPAQYENALYKECKEYFESETGAYSRLGECQGKTIPQLYAHVRVCRPAPPDLPNPSMASFFEIKGVLLQLIPGYSLTDLATSRLAPQDTNMWSDIVQQAVDAAWDINQRGILMRDAAPRNVVVDGKTHKPFIIDFAQCLFKDSLPLAWDLRSSSSNSAKSLDEDEDEDFDIDLEYAESVDSTDNPGAIGCVMIAKVQRLKGVKLNVRFPDPMKGIEDAKNIESKATLE